MMMTQVQNQWGFFYQILVMVATKGCLQLQLEEQTIS